MFSSFSRLSLGQQVGLDSSLPKPTNIIFCCINLAHLAVRSASLVANQLLGSQARLVEEWPQASPSLHFVALQGTIIKGHLSAMRSNESWRDGQEQHNEEQKDPLLWKQMRS